MKYTGTLVSPIVERMPDGGLLAGDAEFAKEAARVKVAQLEKLPALFEAHGVEVGDYQSLALALAETHVAGFKVVERAGAKVKWQVYELTQFKIAVDDLVASGEASSVTHAIDRVRRRPEWSGIIKKSATPSALRKQYDRADPMWVQMLRDALRYRETLESHKSGN